MQPRDSAPQDESHRFNICDLLSKLLRSEKQLPEKATKVQRLWTWSCPLYLQKTLHLPESFQIFQQPRRCLPCSAEPSVLYKLIFCLRLFLDRLRLPKAEAYICREIICSKALRWFVWVLGAYPLTPELSWSCLFRDFLVEKLPSWLFMLEFTEIHEHVGAFVICGHFSLTGVGGCALRSQNAVKRSCSLGPLENTCIS